MRQSRRKSGRRRRKVQRGHPGFLLGEEKKRNRTGRGGKAGLCKKEWVCVKDIQRGPTVVVSDAGVASTYPANAHQEPDTHTHTGLALSIPKNCANCISPTNATRSPSTPSHNPQGTNLESVYSRNPPVPSLPCCRPAFTASEKKDDCARRTKTDRTSRRSGVRMRFKAVTCLGIFVFP